MNTFLNNFPILAIMILFVGAFVTSLVGRRSALARNGVVLVAMTAALAMMLALVKPVLLDGEIITYWLGNWEPVEGWAIGICLEVDALSLFFGLIVTVAVFVSGVYSFTYMNHDDSLVNYYTLFLMLSGSVLGLVLSGDLFNIFVMVEIMTFTAVALTAFRNTYEGALEGALKYLVVGSLGSTSLLVGIAMLYSQLHTLNLAQISALIPGQGSNPVIIAAFAFLFMGFATKAFLFPFQPLAADAHAVAPASISLMISGVLTKCGVYGIIRLCYVLYENMSEPLVQYLVTGFGAVSMFICVTMAFNQHNFKRLLAFHSISQVGYVITAVGLGSALGVSAGLYHAMNHTIFKGLLFLTAGAVQHQTGSLDLDSLGGLSKRMPRTTLLFLIGAASISGLPPFNGFASKWMIYQAAFQRGAATGNFFFLFVCIVALITSVLTLASFIKVAQSVFFGQLPEQYKEVKEVPLAMRIPMWILAALCIVTGLFPNLVQNYLLLPATSAAFNAANYIDQAMGLGYAAAHGIATSGVAGLMVSDCWNPTSWLMLLFCITCAVAIVALLASPNDLKDVHISSCDEQAEVLDAKYESFFSGEESVYSQVGGSDLFWGFKHNWRKYFSYMHDWHSGIVNDYTLYGVVAIAFVLLACIILL
ncbi:MAG: proton-conducting transporter membrane subunit [Candidatus Onthomonas sp.]